MKTILVDDERLMLELFEEECRGISEIEIAGKFSDPQAALAYAETNRVDVAFLDIEMPKLSGLELSDKLRDIYPDIIVIFVSAYEKHMPAAMKEHDADWFLLKPYTADEVKKVLERARLLAIRQRKKVRIHTFGTFEVYVDGEPLPMPRRPKELLAVIVDRNGGTVTASYAYTIMWEQEYRYEEASAYRNASVALKSILRKAGIEYILAYFPNAMAIRPEMVECDYFDLIHGEKTAVQEYMSNYMEEFSWGDTQIARLDYLQKKYDPLAGVEFYENE